MSRRAQGRGCAAVLEGCQRSLPCGEVQSAGCRGDLPVCSCGDSWSRFRQATSEELVEMRAQGERARRESEGVRRPVDPSIASHAAHELVERGTTTMHVGDRELTARVVRFCRGESVLEITVAGAGARSSSMSRISRRLTTEHEPILTGYLTDALQTG